MDNLVSDLTTTTGRIGRQRWWIGTLIVAVIYVVISLLILPMVGFGIPNPTVVPAADGNPAAINDMILAGVRNAGWAGVVMTLIFAYPAYALGVKRRHDRDSNGMDFIIYLILAVILQLTQALGLGYEAVQVGTAVVAAPNTLFSVLAAIVGILAIYLLVVVGFLKGTTGPNRYGPDPLGV